MATFLMDIPFKAFPVPLVGYFLLFLFAAIFFVWLFKALGKLKIMRLNPETQLSPDACTMVALSAVYSEHLGCYLNDLTTNLRSDTIFEIVSHFGIDAFTKKQRTEQFEKVIGALLGDSVSVPEISNANIRLLLDAGLIEHGDDALQVDTVAWNLGRAVMLSRMAYDLKSFDDNKAMAYIEKAYLIASKHYNDWRSFGIAYVVGRMNRDNEDDFHASFIEYLDKLSQDESSPWRRYPFILQNTTDSAHRNEIAR